MQTLKIVNGLQPLIILLKSSILEVRQGFEYVSGVQMVYYVKSVYFQSFFWSVFSGIRNENGDLPCKYPYSVRLRERTDQKNSKCEQFLKSVSFAFSQCIKMLWRSKKTWTIFLKLVQNNLKIFLFYQQETLLLESGDGKY